jgi:hypothetical protein
MSRSKDGGKRGAGVRSSRVPRDRGDELSRFEPVSDDVVLAAVERAERHREREGEGEGEGVMMSDIAEHLGVVHGSWTTRRLRPQVEAFIAAGLLVRSRRHGVLIWGLTSSGRRRVARGGESVVLPESPQHRVWRHARTLAAERIDGLREQVRSVLEDATGVSTPTGSVRMRGSRWLSVWSWRAGSSGRRRIACRSGQSPTTPARTLTTGWSWVMSRSTLISWAGCVIGVWASERVEVG